MDVKEICQLVLTQNQRVQNQQHFGRLSCITENGTVKFSSTQPVSHVLNIVCLALVNKTLCVTDFDANI